MSSSLKTWQLGLICGMSVFLLLIFTLLTGYFYRRFTRSKQLVLSQSNLHVDTEKTSSEIPHGQVFKRIRTLAQPKRNNHTAISWLHGGGTTNNQASNDRNCIVFQPSHLNNQVLDVDGRNVSDPSFSLNSSQNLVTSEYAPTSPPNKTTVSNMIPTTNVFRTVSGSSIMQFGSTTNQLQENKLRQSESISLDRFILHSSKKCRLSASMQFTNASFVDDTLHDEDAWMSILDVVNAELAKLDEQDRIRTLL